MTIFVFTDGACKNNGKSNAIGGWGWIAYYPYFSIEESGNGTGFSKVTNNTMELFAIIAALEFLNFGKFYHFFSDSKLLCQTFVSNGCGKLEFKNGKIVYTGWRKNWNQWKSNLDFFQRFEKILLQHLKNGSQIFFEWIPREYNFVADRLANEKL